MKDKKPLTYISLFSSAGIGCYGFKSEDFYCVATVEILEKRLNIQAGNGYFGNKKHKYSESKIASVVDLSNYPKNDWVKVDIEQREINFKKNIIDFFKSELVV